MSVLGSYITHIEELQATLTKRNARITELQKRRDVHIEIGVKQERERIIKLIEPEVILHQELGLDASADYLTHLIALIKGEK
jgi:hypothetical protein